MKWLIPSNPKFYDSSRKLHDNGYIKWSQTIKVHVGDIIYIYESAVNKFVRFKYVVTRVDIPREQVELDQPITLSELQKRCVQSSWGDHNHDNKERFKYLADRFSVFQ